MRRTVLLLATLVTLLVPVTASASGNDSAATATPVDGIAWTSLTNVRQIVVQGSDWGAASPTPLEPDPLPSCTGLAGYYNLWYRVTVHERSVLRVQAASTDPVRYQPIVQIISLPDRGEAGCGLGNDSRTGAIANATAIVWGNGDQPSDYLIRLAQVGNNGPVGGLPTVTLSISGQDLTQPSIVMTPPGIAEPGVPVTYDASASFDRESDLDVSTASWTFFPTTADKPAAPVSGLKVPFVWPTAGSFRAVFTISDRAGNTQRYDFLQVVRDTIRPTARLLAFAPRLHHRLLRVSVRASEAVTVRLLVTQGGSVLYRGTFRRIRGQRAYHSIRLRHRVSNKPVLVSGIVRDAAQNASALPTCSLDPLGRHSHCFRP